MAEKKFGKSTYRCEKLPATEATAYVFRIGRLAAPLLGQLSNLKLTELAAGKGDDVKTLSAIAGFLTQLDPVEGQKLTIELAEKAQVQTSQGNFEPVIYDAAFAGDVLMGFQVAAWVIQVNFADFFGGKLGDA